MDFRLTSQRRVLIFNHTLVYHRIQQVMYQTLGRNNTHHNYSVNNVSLPDVTVVTDLGVLVDYNLRFTKH